VLPPDGIVRAARRWLQLMTRSSFEQAAALIKAEPSYADLTQTQYAAAIDWLRSAELLAFTGHGLVLAGAAARSHPDDLGLVLFGAALERGQPPWLADADTLVFDVEELPGDAAALAGAVGVSSSKALLTVRQVHGKVDLAERARVGEAGERALVNLLENAWPGSVRHVALEHDGFGYDIEFRFGSDTWHLEVKATTRRSRFVAHLSRHECDIAELDSAWRLIAVGLDEQDQIAAVATASTDVLLSRAPQDRHHAGRWESVRLSLSRDDLTAGLSFLNPEFLSAAPSVLLLPSDGAQFDWMPNANSTSAH
jgi:hypothetical protein